MTRKEERIFRTKVALLFYYGFTTAEVLQLIAEKRI
ncbi:hypothetical protein CFBP1573P_01152 [Pseudomonas syringae pv. persicae]|uniref:Uncharacterized protein n=1 Tax=Pseudomonas syringae pv. persicae TaxID=237306 RepID=A0AB38E9C0_9PSED|nr:hypothetical protein NCPPB2254_00863 [Pseudomonas syringae pv. persicae]SOQ06853.1 hypothetical protein CFBP1573P_01152 [Pseudomonas syringae pv. persicae]